MSTRQQLAETDTQPDTEQSERRRKAFVVGIVVLILVCTGLASGVASSTPSGPCGGSGDLTVQVTDQNGQVQSGQEVRVTDPRTGETRTGTTDQNGQVTFNDITQGQYTVSAGDKTVQTDLNSASKQVSAQIDVSPPTPNGSLPVTRHHFP